LEQSTVSVPICRVETASVSERQDVLAGEEPLEILGGARNGSISMRTPGNDEEHWFSFH